VPRPSKPEPASGASLDTDTIAAIATAPGQGGVGVLRVSGPQATRVAAAVAGAMPPARVASLRSFRDADGEILDSGLLLNFPGPDSFTGEDVVELQGHGGPVVLQMLLRELLKQGARMARPGEFTERAYLNGKLDLTQAEAVADLIASASEAAVRGASRSLAGEFSARISELEARIVRLRVFVEAAIDFADEDLELLESAEVAGGIVELCEELAALRARSAQGVMLRDGVTLALLGPPNVGKSSLLNALAGEERAIVTQIPGTTRDLVRVGLTLGGLPVEVVDTAGLRETLDPVEIEGVRRARVQGELADVVLWLTDLSAADLSPSAAQPDLDWERVIQVGSKVDLTRLAAGRVSSADVRRCREVRVSATTGAGMAELIQAVQELVGFQASESTFTARERHLQALDVAADHLQRSSQLSAAEIDLVAEELRLAHQSLGRIVGEMTSDELLGEIFGTFCVGK